MRIEEADGVECFCTGDLPLGDIMFVILFGIDDRHPGVSGKAENFHLDSIGAADRAAAVDHVDDSAAFREWGEQFDVMGEIGVCSLRIDKSLSEIL